MVCIIVDLCLFFLMKFDPMQHLLGYHGFVCIVLVVDRDKLYNMLKNTFRSKSDW